jgi:hypothetical protein
MGKVAAKIKATLYFGMEGAGIFCYFYLRVGDSWRSRAAPLKRMRRGAPQSSTAIFAASMSSPTLAWSNREQRRREGGVHGGVDWKEREDKRERGDIRERGWCPLPHFHVVSTSVTCIIHTQTYQCERCNMLWFSSNIILREGDRLFNYYSICDLSQIICHKFECLDTCKSRQICNI